MYGHRGRHSGGGGLPFAYVLLGLIVGAATENAVAMTCFIVGGVCMLILAFRRIQ